MDNLLLDEAIRHVSQGVLLEAGFVIRDLEHVLQSGGPSMMSHIFYKIPSELICTLKIESITKLISNNDANSVVGQSKLLFKNAVEKEVQHGFG